MLPCWLPTPLIHPSLTTPAFLPSLLLTSLNAYLFGPRSLITTVHMLVMLTFDNTAVPDGPVPDGSVPDGPVPDGPVPDGIPARENVIRK